MEVLIVQSDIRWMEPDVNLPHLDGLIQTECRLTGYRPDIIVLPEMFATGFSMESARCAGWAGEILDWMRKVAVDHDCAVAGTLAVGTAGVFHNRFCFVRPDGISHHYDKRHLFTFAGEQQAYKAGTKRVVVRWRGFDILMQTCYDLRFPVFSRNTGDYHLTLYPASWVGSRIGVWDTLLRARAIENAAYVIGVNRVGSDPSGSYPGHSVAVDFKGNIMADLPQDREAVLRCSLSLEELHRFREKFPVLQDADGFVLA